MWSRLKTAIIVLILSLLIWGFAERAVTQETTVNIWIELTNPTEDLLAQYLGVDGTPIPETRQKVQLSVRGPTGRIQTINRDYMQTVPLNIQEMGLDLAPGESARDYNVPIMAILQWKLYSADQKNFLQVVGSHRKTLPVRLTQLNLETLPIRIYSSEGTELVTRHLEPKTIQAYVYEKNQVARVSLTPAQQQQALDTVISVNAQTPLPGRPGQFRDFPVSLQLSPEIGRETMKIRQPRLGFLMPPTMQGKYKVIYDPAQLDEYNPIECVGTPEAFDSYNKSDFHLILILQENDQNKEPVTLSRQPVYFLQEERGRIEIVNKKQVPITFRIQPVGENVTP